MNRFKEFFNTAVSGLMNNILWLAREFQVNEYESHAQKEYGKRIVKISIKIEEVE